VTPNIADGCSCVPRAGLSQSAALFQLRIRVNLPSLPLPLPYPSPPFSSHPLPSLSLPSPDPPRREAAPLKPAKGSGGALAAVAFCCIVCSQNAPGCSISGSLVITAMSGKMKANFRVQNGGPPNVGGLSAECLEHAKGRPCV